MVGQNRGAENVTRVVCYNGQVNLTAVYFHTKKIPRKRSITKRFFKILACKLISEDKKLFRYENSCGYRVSVNK